MRSALSRLAIVVLLLGVPGTSGASAPAEWRTVAEATGFEATSSYDETMSFLEQLAAARPEIELLDFGLSAQNRRMRLVVVSSDRAFTPETAAATGKAIVLIQNGIHAGEIDGKDASLMILRDIARGKHRELLEGLILLVVPIYNVDGHERVSPYNRPNQDGPVRGMGFRTTADGHDLNRDHLKLSTPEARRMIDLFNRWRPHLHVDNHVTNGTDHDWVLTYSWVEGPQAPPGIATWLDVHMPRVVKATERAGHRVGPYVSLLDRNDPSKGFNSYVGQPRYATGYYPLRSRPSILVENHAHKPYERRVRANRDFLLALLEQAAASSRGLIEAVRADERRTVSLGRPDAPASDVVLRYSVTEPQDRVLFPVYEWYHEPSEALGIPLLRFRRGKLRETEVPWVHRARAETSVARPRGYLVMPGWPVIESRLAGHALRVEQLRREVELDVEAMRLSDPQTRTWGGPSYQGLTLIDVDVERRTERRRFPAGTLWIPADQPDFEVAVQLLEPEAPDSMTSWGLLNIVLERKEWIGPRTLEDRVREMLKDPGHAAAWKQALRDEAFAADPRARALWWYRRTVYWDETVGLLPIMRLMTPARLETAPWNARAHGELRRGPWHAWLDSPGGRLPFGIELVDGETGLRAFLVNGSERIEIERVEMRGRRVVLGIEHYDATIEARMNASGTSLDGRWWKTAGPGKISELPFHARAGLRPRFAAEQPPEGGDGARAIDGRWAVQFQSEDLPAVGLFEAGAGDSVTGTFLTASGDYRYLEGSYRRGRLRLSVFDGAHAFLFDARMQPDGTLSGGFWSRDSWHETWTARRDPQARAPNGLEQTRWVGGRELGGLVFPDLEGRPRALDDPQFAGRARILQIFGSWCPNCNDATAYLVELDERYRSRGLSVLGLAFEMTGDATRDADQVRRYADYHGVEFPVLLAGLSDKDEASRAFPLVDRVRAFPTTIFLDAEGRVQAVHSGYAGPATGKAHLDLRVRFEGLIEELLGHEGTFR